MPSDNGVIRQVRPGPHYRQDRVPADASRGNLWFNYDTGEYAFANGIVYGTQVVSGNPGMIVPFGGGVAPAGWLFADGSAVDRGVYADLFAVIGTTFGAGDGSTTFNLPDMRNRTTLGVNGSHPLAQAAGSENVGVSTAQLAPHIHIGAAHVHSSGSHTHLLNGWDPTARNMIRSGTLFDPATTGYGGGNYYGTIAPLSGFSMRTFDGSGATSANSGTTGSGNAHNNMQPYVVTKFIVKY